MTTTPTNDRHDPESPVAHDRDEDDTCQAGTPGCCIDHRHPRANRCETW